MFGNKALPAHKIVFDSWGRSYNKINLEHYITKEEFEKLYYEQKLTYPQILKLIEYPAGNPHFVRQVQKAGWKRERGSAHINHVNESVFDEWNAENAWLFGWIITDGHVNHNYVDLTLQERDIDVLEKAKTIFQYSGDFYRRKGYNTLRIHNRSIVERLYQLGIPKENKTFECSMPNIPDEYFWDFMRGAFEGDGNINVITNANSIFARFCSASEKFTDQIHSHLVQAGIDARIDVFDKSKHRFYMVNARNSADSVKWLTLMYKDSNPQNRMNRKYNKFISYCEGYLNRPLKKCGTRRKGVFDAVCQAVRLVDDLDHLKNLI